MTEKTTSLGLHTIDETGSLALDEAVFEHTSLERGGDCLVIATEGGGLTIMPVEEDFDPKPSGQ